MIKRINFLTKSDVAELLCCSETTVMRMVAAGKLPVYKLSDQIYRFDEADIYEYIEGRKSQVAGLQRKTRVRRPQDLRVCTYRPGDKVV